MLLENEQATLNLARDIAKYLPENSAFCVYLQGNLGAGKTTFVRGLLHALGHVGHVKSPTYTLVEHYILPGFTVYHFDLYRLADPEELLYMGLEDYFSEGALLLVEWPDKGGDWLTKPDIEIHLNYEGTQRNVHFSAHSTEGEKLLTKLNI